MRIVSVRKKMESKVVRTFLVPSKSVPGDYHRVEVLASGEVKCECIGVYFHENCTHKKAVEKQLEENGNTIHKIKNK